VTSESFRRDLANRTAFAGDAYQEL